MRTAYYPSGVSAFWKIVRVMSRHLVSISGYYYFFERAKNVINSPNHARFAHSNFKHNTISLNDINSRPFQTLFIGRITCGCRIGFNARRRQVTNMIRVGRTSNFHRFVSHSEFMSEPWSTAYFTIIYTIICSLPDPGRPNVWKNETRQKGIDLGAPNVSSGNGHYLGWKRPVVFAVPDKRFWTPRSDKCGFSGSPDNPPSESIHL